MRFFTPTVIRVIGIVVGVVIVVFIVRWLVNKTMVTLSEKRKLKGEQKKRVQTLSSVLQTTITFVMLAVGLVVLLGQLGISIAPILASVGVVGIAVGFAAQNFVRDVISGFIIFFENHYNINDVISAAGVAGLVEDMNLRRTVLRDLEGKVHIVPNGEIRVLTNMTKEWSRCVLDIGVAYKEDVDNVMNVLKQIGDELYNDKDFKQLIMEPLQILGVDDFADSQVTIKVMFKTKPIQQWTVAREFRRRIKKVFDEKGIEIPFPHCTIYMGEAPSEGKLAVELINKNTAHES